MKTSWNYRNIVDLEYFLAADRQEADMVLHQRDREIFLLLKNGDAENRAPAYLLTRWLATRVAREFGEKTERSPGQLFADALALARILAITCGMVSGAGAGLTFFTYTGATPINVFLFLLLFVLPQILLTFLLFCSCLLRVARPRSVFPSFYTSLLQRLLTHLQRFLQRRWRGGSGTTIGAANADYFTMRASIFAPLFYWPLFQLSQLFAIACNGGLLAVTLIKITTSDLAFGWQSTLQVSGAAVHRLTTIAALPWSWLLPEVGHPSLAEIEGSRIILKEGIAHLASGNLTAWWPFLVLSLFCYGLLLRFGLLLLGRFFAAHAWQRLPLTETAACRAVVRRMLTPTVSSQAAPEASGKKDSEEAATEPAPATPLDPTHPPQIVLIPDDITGLCPPAKLVPLLAGRGLTITETHTFMVGYDEDLAVKDMIASRGLTGPIGIFILMEGWMPPLVAFLSYLSELRLLLPDRTIIHLGLVGRPTRTGFSPLTDQDLLVWRKKTGTLRDPYLEVFALPPERTLS